MVVLWFGIENITLKISSTHAKRTEFLLLRKITALAQTEPISSINCDRTHFRMYV